MSFGKVLKIERIKNDLSSTELAEKAGISRQYLCDIENNRSQPSLKVLLNLDKALPDSMLYEKYKKLVE